MTMTKKTRTRTALLAATAVAGVLSLTACGGGSEKTASTSPASDTAAAPAQTGATGNGSSGGGTSDGSATGNGTAGGVSTGGKNGGTGLTTKDSASGGREVRSDCTTSDFTGVKLVAKGQEMNSRYYDLQLTGNKATCRTAGFPGFSLLDAQGHQIGEPATHSKDGTDQAVTLKPGQVLHAQVKTPDSGVTDGKCDAKAAKIKVYPPDNTAALTSTATAGIRVCGSDLQIATVSTTAP
ncbi:DUF4232 domain-containing protein [Streptomyces sp. NPDC047002]|uniref:DUF4232 domain-containing protein n=1 Tax=Streptomyces sp. NPDC047002 TaxID=3155475 RepID=UPI0034536918